VIFGSALLALAALLCVAALLPATASAVTTSISGTVTGEDTATGIEGVEVCATRIGGAFLESCELTAADGTYLIDGLPAAEYEVWFYAGGTGYRSEGYPDTIVVEVDPITGIDAELAPVSSITGTVTRSSDGAPVEEVEVCAWEWTTFEYAGCAWSGSDGSYRIEGLEPGEYGVEFWPYETGQDLVVQYFDRRDRWQEADPVSVGEGETVSDVDGVLDAGAIISGHVSSAANGAALAEIAVCAIDAPSSEPWECNWTDENGDYELRGLSKGQYKVVFSIDFEEWYEEDFGEEEDDGYPTEFWNEQTTLAAANTINLATSQTVTGIDAHLGSPPPPPPPLMTPPPAAPITSPTVKPRAKHCRKGFKRKKVKGKVRCVKRKKHHRHRHHQHPLAGPATGTFSPPFEGRGWQRPSRFSR
jgi:hypothetical protein